MYLVSQTTPSNMFHHDMSSCDCYWLFMCLCHSFNIHLWTERERIAKKGWFVKSWCMFSLRFQVVRIGGMAKLIKYALLKQGLLSIRSSLYKVNTNMYCCHQFLFKHYTMLCALDSRASFAFHSTKDTLRWRLTATQIWKVLSISNLNNEYLS